MHRCTSSVCNSHTAIGQEENDDDNEDDDDESGKVFVGQQSHA